MLELKFTQETYAPLQDQLDMAFNALGYFRRKQTVALLAEGSTILSSGTRDVVGQVAVTEERAVAADAPASSSEAIPAATEQPVGAGARERGKPRPGQLRRNSAEKAEDDAADAADLAAGGAAPALIRTDPENRVGPQDSAEVQAQDKADEQAETEAKRVDGKATLDDVRDAVARYIAAFGFAAATTDTKAIFGCAMLEIPASPENFAAASAAVDTALAVNQFARARVDAGATAAKVATLDGLKAAMGLYMRTYGEDHGFKDLPQVIGVASIADLAADPAVYAAKIQAVNDAVAGNPFGRTAVAA